MTFEYKILPAKNKEIDSSYQIDGFQREKNHHQKI